MKKSKWLSSLSALGTATLVVPIVTTALSSCSCSTISYAGEDMLKYIEEPYIPEWESMSATEDVTIPQGNEAYWTWLTDEDTNAKKQVGDEFRFTASMLPPILAGILGIGVEPGEGIYFKKFEAKLSNFKITNEDEHRASYTTTTDIQIALNVPNFVSGSIRLAWHHDVVNAPIGFFDLDPSKIVGDMFSDGTLWYVAPDLSSVEAGDKTWYVDMNWLLDGHIKLMGSRIIDLNNETLHLKLNTVACALIESIFEDKRYGEDKLLYAYFIERLLGLASGYFSYYMFGSNMPKHLVETKWITDTTPLRPEIGIVTAETQLTKSAQAEYTLDDHYDKVGVVTLNLREPEEWDPEWALVDLLSCIVLDSSVEGSIDTLESGSSKATIDLDWSNPYRPLPGTDIAGLHNAEGDWSLPMIVTKDWITFGTPFNLKEASGDKRDIYDDLHTEGDEKATAEIQLPQVQADRKTSIEFHISNEEYNNLSGNNPKHIVDIKDVEVEEENSKINKFYSYELDTDMGEGLGYTLSGSEGSYKLKVYLRPKGGAAYNEDDSLPFNILIGEGVKSEWGNIEWENTYVSSPFQVKPKKFLTWNTTKLESPILVDKEAPLKIDDVVSYQPEEDPEDWTEEQGQLSCYPVVFNEYGSEDIGGIYGINIYFPSDEDGIDYNALTFTKYDGPEELPSDGIKCYLHIVGFKILEDGTRCDIDFYSPEVTIKPAA